MEKPLSTPTLWVFAHGWSNTAAHWLPLLSLLDHDMPAWRANSTVLLWEQNYYSPDEPCFIEYPTGQHLKSQTSSLHELAQKVGAAEVLGVGHSLGFAKLLSSKAGWTGLLSLHGFTRFCAHYTGQAGTPVRLLLRMIQQFKTHPAQVLSDFKRRTGLNPPLSTAPYHSDRLLDDLVWMTDLDVSLALNAHCDSGKLFCAAWSDNDPIVPVALSRECFQLVIPQNTDTPPTRVIPNTPHEGPSLFPRRYTALLSRFFQPLHEHAR